VVRSLFVAGDEGIRRTGGPLACDLPQFMIKLFSAGSN